MRSTKHITMGAMVLGLSAIIQLLDRSTLGFFMSFLAVPLVVYGYFFSTRSSIVVYVASIGLSFVLTAYPPTIITVAGYGFVGLVLIYGMNNKWSNLKRIISASIAIIPVYVIMIGFFAPYFGFSIPESVQAIYTVLPVLPMQVITVFVYFVAAVLAVMEVYIIKASSEIIVSMLSQRFNGMTK